MRLAVGEDVFVQKWGPSLQYGFALWVILQVTLHLELSTILL